MSDQSRTNGVWPVMLTPFTESKEVDWDGLTALTEWYLASGVQGLFAVCLSSEMYDLLDDERLRVAKHVASVVDGRAPVFASGTFGASSVPHSTFVRRMADTGVDGVVVIASQMADEGEGEDVWKESVSRLLDETDADLGIYECPRPYHRLVASETLKWCASTGRFTFIKDTSCSLATIAQKIDAVKGTPLRFYNANTATLLDSLIAGGDGFCGVSANVYPDLHVWLCESFSDRPDDARALQRFLSVAEKVVGFNYPGSSKLYLGRRGVAIQPFCRVRDFEYREADLITLDHLGDLADEWRDRLGVSAAGLRAA